MPMRRGVSLVEVLVAAILLAIGIGGSLSALLAAARMRDQATTRERLAFVAGARLDRFAAVGCAASDTVAESADALGVREHWRVTRSGGAVRLDGRVESGPAARTVHLAIAHTRRCP